MVTVGSFEAKNQLSELLRRVQAGEEVLITRHGRPLARLTPPYPSSSGSDARAALAALRELRSAARLGRKEGESLSKASHAGHRW